MNDDTQDSGHRRRYFRYAVFTLAGLLVVSLGFVLIPREPAVPAAPPFSEQTRAAAYSDAMDLRAAGADLAGAADGALPATESGEVSAAVGRTVTLLTVQARALMLPAGPSEAGSPSVAPSSVPVSPPPTPAKLAAALQRSAAQRLSDAETADGGMARLLAGVGIAQLLAAEKLASAAGIALDPPAGANRPSAVMSSPGPASPAPSSPLPASPDSTATAGCTAPATGGSATSGSGGSGSAESGSTGSGSAGSGSPAASTGVDLASSLASAWKAELELVYAYQAALTRLNPGSVAPASDFLAQHEELRDEAAAMSGARCAALPPTPAGYALDEAFLSGPAAVLGPMEAGVLPVYGDVIALSEGAERAWAVRALQSSARRTVHWGASPGPVPGVVLDEAGLPTLPAAATVQGPAPAVSRQP